MTPKSRYVLVGLAGLLLVGLGGGLVAYFAFNRAAGSPAGLPAELRYVPADAAMVAYADVHSLMDSDLRRELERTAASSGRGQQQMHEFAGIQLDKDINHIVAYLHPEPPDAGSGASANRPPNALILAQGKFDQAAVEQFVKDHGGSVEDYHGKHLLVRPMEQQGGGRGRAELPTPDAQVPRMPQTVDQMAITFLQSDLMVVGPIELVRRAIDNTTSTANITTNTELMGLMHDASSGNAWVVGRFDAVSRRLGLPAAVRQQVPPLRLVSATARVNGGIRATVKAQTADKAAADQLRDVVRGAVSFLRLQSGSKPEVQDSLKSIEVSGTGTDVQLSFMLTADAFRNILPQRRAPADQPLLQPLPPPQRQ